MKDVSRESGLSTFTVSRALAGAEGVSKESREAVLRVAEEMGYVPNLAAQKLRGVASSTIAVITAGTSNAYYLDMMNGIQAVAQDMDQTVVLTDIAIGGVYDIGRERQTIQRLLEGRVGGVISTLTLLPESVKRLEDWEIPIVFVDSSPPEELPYVPSVTTDNYNASLLVGAHLQSHAFQDWLLLVYPPIWSSRKERERGLRDAAAKAGATIEVVEAGNNAASASKALRDCLGRRGGRLPDILIAGNNPILLGAFQVARERNTIIPDNMAMVCFDDFPFAPYLDPPVTVLNERSEEIGRLSAHMLTEIMSAQIEARKAGKPAAPIYTNEHQLQVPVDLVVRRSCGCPDPTRSRS
nr:LacI family DNA-binding transcriptional regulator [Jiella flava]